MPFKIDQEALLARLREQYASHLSPLEVIASLGQALGTDIPASETMLKYVEPQDRPPVEARVERKRALLRALQACHAILGGASAG